MVMIPRPDTAGKVGLQRDPGSRASAADFGAIEAQVAAQGGAQLQQAGAQLAGIGTDLAAQTQRLTREREDADIRMADVELSKSLREFENPETGFLSRRGTHAMDGYKDAQKAIATIKDGILEKLTPEARARYAPDAERRVSETDTRLVYHVGAEHRAFEAASFKASLETFANDAATNYDNDKLALSYVARGVSEILERGRRNGAPEEAAQRDALTFQSAALRQIIQNKAIKDPVGALKFFQDNRHRVLGGDLDSVESSLKNESRTAEATSRLDAFMSGTVPMGVAGGVDALFEAVKRVESGNRDYNADGTLVTSSKGAMGAAQVMPGTAAAPGYGVTPAKDGGAGELQRVGKDYLGAMLKTYGGNRTLALAAYNAGPGKVDEWIKTYGDPRSGQVSDEEFARKIPYAETRDYVGKVLKGSQAPSVRPNLPAGLAYAQTISDPETRLKFLSMLHSQISWRNADEDRAHKLAEQSIKEREEATAKAGLTLQAEGKLTPEWVKNNQANLSVADYKALLAATAGGAKTDDVGAVADLTARLDTEDVLSDATHYLRDGRITIDTFQSIIGKNRSYLSDDKPASPYKMGREHINATLDPGPMSGMAEMPLRIARANALQEFDIWIESNRTATRQQIREEAEAVVARYRSIAWDKISLTIGLPRGYGGARSDITSADLDKAEDDVSNALSAGAMPEAVARDEARKIEQWRGILALKAGKKK